MNRGSTLFLKFVVAMIGIAVLAFCTIALPSAIFAELSSDFDYLPLLLGLYIPAIPFFVGLYQVFKLLNSIDKNQVFSEVSVQSLKTIKYCAFTVSAIFAVSMPYIFFLADMDDAPGLAAIGFVIIFASFVLGTTVAVFQKLLQNVVEIKSESDLTV